MLIFLVSCHRCNLFPLWSQYNNVSIHLTQSARPNPLALHHTSFLPRVLPATAGNVVKTQYFGETKANFNKSFVQSNDIDKRIDENAKVSMRFEIFPANEGSFENIPYSNPKLLPPLPLSPSPQMSVSGSEGRHFDTKHNI